MTRWARRRRTEPHCAPDAPRPAAPPDSRVYAVGDIHGRLEPLAELVEAMARDSRRADARRRVAIFLGDYVDRGLRSRQVVDFLLSDPLLDFETVFLKGNHEAMLLAFLDDAEAGPPWLAAGGLATLVSYGITFPPGPPDPERLESLRDGLDAALPAAHRVFLENLAPKHVEGDYAFVHAGIRPGTPLAEQREADLLWAGAEFTEDARDHGGVIVHGHSVTSEPVVRPNRIGIDTGSYATGRLTCLVLQGTQRTFLST